MLAIKEKIIKKPIEEMTDHEMLVELMKDKRRQDRNRYIKNGVRMVIAIAVIVLLIIIVPPVVRYFRQLNETMQQIRTGIEQVGGAAETVRDKVTEGVDKLTEVADEAKEQIDRSISDLEDAAGIAKEQIEQGIGDLQDLYNSISGTLEDFGSDELEKLKEAGEQLNDLMNSLPSVFR